MSTMMGAPAGGQEDMFAKLESMRAVITEVNTQFKDPVSFPSISLSMFRRLQPGRPDARVGIERGLGCLFRARRI